MKPPSREWREDVAPDEEERFQRYAEQFSAFQQVGSRKYGKGRALHRKGLLAARGQLEVLADLPEHARHGLFAQPRTHEAQIRLSSGSMFRQPDSRPDVRGFAIKVLGVDGPGALGSPVRSQDFLLINHESFSSAKSSDFAELAIAASRGLPSLVRHLVHRHGLLGGLRRVAALGKSLGRPFSGFATETFFSAVPIACGPYAVRLRLLPGQGEPDPDARKDWAADMRSRLARGPLAYSLQLQFFVDEAITPIEDASVSWPESEAPYVTVARLALPEQDLGSEDARRLAGETEAASFDPWNALLEHRPLGEVMRARKVIYFASQKARA